jgi:hypothetical protein
MVIVLVSFLDVGMWCLNAGDLRQTIRSEFEQHRFEKSQQTIRFLISDGLQKLKQLNTMLGIQGHDLDIRV